MANNGWYKLDPANGKRRHAGKNAGMAMSRESGLPKEKAALKRPPAPVMQEETIVVPEVSVPLPKAELKEETALVIEEVAPPTQAEKEMAATHEAAGSKQQTGKENAVACEEQAPAHKAEKEIVEIKEEIKIGQAIQQESIEIHKETAPRPDTRNKQEPEHPKSEKHAMPAPPPPIKKEAAHEKPGHGSHHKQIEQSLTVGERGPVLLQDTALHETLDSFVSSTSLSRIVHTKGFGAKGYFQVTHSMKAHTKASIFQAVGTKVPVMTRFSLAVSNPGTPDSGRNVRGFSTKFYTHEGNFDLLCNHIPVFLVRDAIRFPESIRAFQPSPKNNLLDPNLFWGFVATAPEATHFLTWLYSDYGTVKSLRHICASSVNTYVWRNAAGGRCYVKYHWIPTAGERYIDKAESIQLAGQDPDIAGRDLFDTIAAGKPVEYELKVQLMDIIDERSLPYDPLDDTKIWDETSYPLMPVGKLVLDQNPGSFKEEIERVAFSPANLLEGIELSDDKMLQGRSTIYWDAQRHRLGNDFRDIPVNKQANFKPSDLVTSGEGQFVEGREVRAELSRPDNFTQAGERFRSLSDMAQKHLIDNIASELYLVDQSIRETVLGYLSQASAQLGEGVRAGMRAYAAKK